MYMELEKGVLRLEDAAFIPRNEDNSDYVRFLQWVAEGGIPLLPEQKQSTPAEIKQAIDKKRDEQLTAGALWNGDRWHTNNDFILHLNSFILAFSEGMLPPNMKMDIRTNTNQIRQLGHAELKALAMTVMMYVQKVYADSWGQKDAIK